MSGAYATNKLAAHPEALERLRDGRRGTLITVHLMPQNVCNHSCSFCSYRMPGNKNSSVFVEGDHIPLAHLGALIEDFRSMGVRGVEITGGGEPLAYPHFVEMCRLLGGFRVALVTNGTLLDAGRLDSLRRVDLAWARVSIDAAEASTYAVMRDCPQSHFARAWTAVEALAQREETTVGVGFVLSNENVSQVYPFVKRAKASGAGNVRLTVTYSDRHADYFTDRAAVEAALEDGLRAVADFQDESFTVHNLMPARWGEVQAPEQDYDFCPTQQLLCVVEGSGKVYTCCTFTGSNMGMQGVFWDHQGGFRGLWEEKQGWRSKLNPRSYCKVSCLYRERNLEMLRLMERPVHTEFI